MKIIVGKVGQRLIFNRESSECDRSNTNGNVSAYALFNMLFELNKNDTFYVLTENDGFLKKYNNVIDISNYTIEEINKIKADFALFIPGIIYKKYEIKKINNLNVDYNLLVDDKRCLNALNINKDLIKLPNKILSQFEGKYIFKNKKYNVIYCELEKAILYNCNLSEFHCKYTILNCFANSTKTYNKDIKLYNRLKIVNNLIQNTDIRVYGRLYEGEYYSPNFEGELSYKEAQLKMSQSLATLLVPVEKNFVTSKYVEALMNYTMPVFYKDYNTKLLKFVKKKYIVKNNKQLIKLYNYIKNNQKKVLQDVFELRQKIILPYLNGKILNERIMSNI